VYAEEAAVGMREVAVDRHTMLLVGSAIVAFLFIAYVTFGLGGHGFIGGSRTEFAIPV
jgi:hypothetical protein